MTAVPRGISAQTTRCSLDRGPEAPSQRRAIAPIVATCSLLALTGQLGGCLLTTEGVTAGDDSPLTDRDGAADTGPAADGSDGSRPGAERDVALLDAIDAADAPDAPTDAVDRPDALDASMSDAPTDVVHPQPPNDTCARAIELNLGGVFHGTTCGGSDDALLSCGTSARPEVFYKLTAKPGSMYYLSFSGGIIIGVRQSTCGDYFGPCLQAPVGTRTTYEFSGGVTYWFAVETSGTTGCGAFSITVARRS